MRIGRRLRRSCLALACAALLAASPPVPGATRGPVVATGTAVAAAARGGWVPHHLNACALALGLMWGGAAGIPINPMGGATAFAIGVGISLFACS